MTQPVLFANNAQTTIAGTIAATATSVTLASGSGALFPSPASGQYYVATFVDAATGLITEIVHVTAMSGDVATIVRAQEGTTAKIWNAGDIFGNFWTAGSANLIYATAAASLTAFVEFADSRATGTNGGNATAGTFVTRTLQTVTADPGGLNSGGTISLNTGTNVITLQPGTYKLTGRATCNANNHKVRWYNVGAAGVLVGDSGVNAYGTNENCVTYFATGNPQWSSSVVTCVVTVAPSTTLQVTLQHRADNLYNGGSATDFGQPMNDTGIPEIYATAEIYKIA